MYKLGNCGTDKYVPTHTRVKQCETLVYACQQLRINRNISDIISAAFV